MSDFNSIFFFLTTKKLYPILKYFGLYRKIALFSSFMPRYNAVSMSAATVGLVSVPTLSRQRGLPRSASRVCRPVYGRFLSRERNRVSYLCRFSVLLFAGSTFSSYLVLKSYQRRLKSILKLPKVIIHKLLISISLKNRNKKNPYIQIDIGD